MICCFEIVELVHNLSGVSKIKQDITKDSALVVRSTQRIILMSIFNESQKESICSVAPCPRFGYNMM